MRGLPRAGIKVWVRNQDTVIKGVSGSHYADAILTVVQHAVNDGMHPDVFATFMIGQHPTDNWVPAILT